MEVDRRYEREWGNLLWVCHLYWLQYRFTMDRRMLRERLLPLLAEAVALYDPILSERPDGRLHLGRSEEHTSELQSLMRISYAVFCLKKKNCTRHERLSSTTNDSAKTKEKLKTEIKTHNST